MPYALDFSKCGFYGYVRVDGCDIAKYVPAVESRRGCIYILFSVSSDSYLH